MRQWHRRYLLNLADAIGVSLRDDTLPLQRRERLTRVLIIADDISRNVVVDADAVNRAKNLLCVDCEHKAPHCECDDISTWLGDCFFVKQELAKPEHQHAV